MISAFVFATRIVQFIYFLHVYSKFPVSSHLLCLNSPVCVGPVRKPHCWFSHEAAQLMILQDHCIRKPTICICETKGADQLCSNYTADQCLWMEQIRNFKLLACFCDCTGRFVSDLETAIYLVQGSFKLHHNIETFLQCSRFS